MSRATASTTATSPPRHRPNWTGSMPEPRAGRVNVRVFVGRQRPDGLWPVIRETTEVLACWDSIPEAMRQATKEHERAER